jgi:hypothetical protein
MQQADVLADHIRNKISPRESSQCPSPTTVATPAGERDVYEKLRKLGELRDAEVLTPEEFEAKKASRLSEI